MFAFSIFLPYNRVIVVIILYETRKIFMDRIFNMDNKFFVFMGRVADLMILNILCIICCIPIITIGASVTAMYYVTLKMTRNEESYIVRSFFKSFKENFKQATVIWLVALVAGLLLGFDFYIMGQMSTTFAKVVRYGLAIIALVYAMVMLYVFPVLSKFYNTIRATVRNALLMSIRHLPQTIAMLAITIIPVILTLTIAEVMVYGSLVWILVGFALIAFINSQFLVRIFDRYIPEEGAEGEETTEVSEEITSEEEIVGVTPVFSEEFIKKNSESTLADSETDDESTDENND